MLLFSRHGAPSEFRHERRDLDPRRLERDHAQPVAPQRTRGARVLRTCVPRVPHHQQPHLPASARRARTGSSVEAASKVAPPVRLLDAQLPLDLLERYALCFRNHRSYPQQLKHHHSGKERKNVAWRKYPDHLRKERGEQGGENPVSEATERLPFRSMPIRKNL